MSKSRKPKTPEAPKFPEVPLVVETFSNPDYHLDSFARYGSKPSCFNGLVSYRKYRVTAELVDEPIEVIQERIRKLWRECDNMHHLTPLHAAAKQTGFELDPEELGKDRKSD